MFSKNSKRFYLYSCFVNRVLKFLFMQVFTDMHNEMYVFMSFLIWPCNFTFSKYKVDCACVRGNQECPVLKHNLEPTENLGQGTRRRGRKDKEPAMRDDSGQNQNLTLDCDGPKGKTSNDGKQRKLSPLRVSISNNQVLYSCVHTYHIQSCTVYTHHLYPNLPPHLLGVKL